MVLRPGLMGGVGDGLRVGGMGGLFVKINFTTITALSTYSSDDGTDLARSNLGPTSFSSAILNGGARLIALGGTGNVRIYLAGCNNHMISVSIPSGSNGPASMILNCSGVRRCTSALGSPSSCKSSMNHCTGHVGSSGLALTNGACGLGPGSGNGYLRNNNTAN